MACRVPFSTTFTLFAALVPAVVIWAIMYTTIDDSMDVVTHVSVTTITDLSSSLQSLLITDSLASLAAHLEQASQAVAALLALLASKRMGERDLSASPTLMESLLADFGKEIFASMLANEFFSFIDLECGEGRVGGGRYPKAAWTVWQALNYDVATNSTQRSVYLSTLSTNVYHNQTVLGIYYPNQVTVDPLTQIGPLKTYPASVFLQTVQKKMNSWGTDVVFSQYSGQTEVYYGTRAYPAANNTFYGVTLALNTHTISDDLRAKAPNTTKDRLFIFFRQPHGHMLGASHGKFYSQSDVDSREVNPLLHPPNMSALWPYTCFDSNDATIVAACSRLYALSGNNWSNVPQLSTEMVLLGEVYWVSTGFSSEGLDCTMVELNYKAAIMGPVDEQIDTATSDINRKKAWTYAVLGITTFFAILMPLLIGFWLSSQLAALGGRLRNAEKLHLSGRAASYSIFTELRGVQDACTQLEQGLARLLPASAGQRIVVWSDAQLRGEATDNPLAGRAAQ